MSKFTGRERLFIGALIAVCGVRLWRDRKLKRAVRTFEYNNRLLLAATRVAQNARSLLDIEQILKVTIQEVVPAFGVNQFIVRIDGGVGGPPLVRHYSGDGGGEAVSALAADFDACRTVMGDRARNYYLRQEQARWRDGAQPPETAKPILGAPIAHADQYLEAMMVRSDDPTRVWLDDEVQALLAVAHQVWESVSQARLFAEKEQQSLTDSLTRCPNRRAFDLRLGSDLGLAGETGKPLSLVMVDVDHFKRVNDTYGHAPGDQVLRALADVLREEVTGGAMAARIGGEEFALVLPGFGVEKAVALAERTRAHVACMKVPGINGQITASFGVATFPLHAASCSSLIESADRALYHAKSSGRNRVLTP